MRHVTVPVFVPFAGCPQRCVYCDQRAIAADRIPSADEVSAALAKACTIVFAGNAVQPPAENAQIAFFGGSFTAIPQPQMIALLHAAQPYLCPGKFSSIRVSTRPDAVEAPVLTLLRQYGVRTVELGAQSMFDEVLSRNRRGHTAETTAAAAVRVKQFGFELGLQMMTGLYGSTPQQDLKTAEKLLALRPDFLRVYPTVVLEGTELAALWRSGEYVPPSLTETVTLCAEIAELAHNAEIPIIRMGLHSDLCAGQPLAGPFHPAFGELVTSCRLLRRMQAALSAMPAGKYTVFAAPGSVSPAVGQHKSNVKALAAQGWQIAVRPECDLAAMEIKIEKGAR